MDKGQLRSLVVARGLLENATTRDETEGGRVAAVVLCDLAVETAANAVLQGRQPPDWPGSPADYQVGKSERQNRGSFREPGLRLVLDCLLALHRIDAGDEHATLESLRGARLLHDRRNGVQHRGEVPASESVEAARVHAGDFASEISRPFLDVDFLALSMASLVSDAEIREKLEAAGAAAERDDLGQAAQDLAIAWEMIRWAARPDPYSQSAFSRMEGVNPMMTAKGAMKAFVPTTRGRLPISQVPSNAKSLSDLLERMIKAVQRAESRLDALSLGADPATYSWFAQRIPPALRLTTLGNPVPEWVSSEPKVTLTAAEFRRARDFVTSTALSWQAIPGQPPRPDTYADPA